MTLEIVIVILVLMVLVYLTRSKPKPRVDGVLSNYKVPFYKMIYNPFDETWMWCRLNYETRIWEWYTKASLEHVELYGKEDLYYTEERFQEIMKEETNG